MFDFSLFTSVLAALLVGRILNIVIDVGLNYLVTKRMERMGLVPYYQPVDFPPVNLPPAEKVSPPANDLQTGAYL